MGVEPMVRDIVILEFIARRRIGELARSKSNIEGEALHTRRRQRARKRRQRASPRPLCYYLQIRVVICVFIQRYWWAESLYFRL